MAWVNLFDLSECDIYVRYNGVTPAPSQEQWVRIDLLDPAIGTVEVIDGEIRCSFEDGSGGGGLQPSLLIIPRTQVSGKVRFQASEDGQETYISDGGIYLNIGEVLFAGDGIVYDYNIGAGGDMEFTGEEDLSQMTEVPGVLPSGSGIEFYVYPPGH